MFGSNFAPNGWALTNGQLLSISQNTALFSLVGTSFGGNGISNFALPNLQSRMPMNQGQGPGLSGRTVGDQGGAETATLQGDYLPRAPTPPIAASIGYQTHLRTISPFLVLTFIIALQGIYPSRG
jgi:microcystin-dependent protein